MKNKIIKISIISVIILILLFIGYKGIMYYRYTAKKPDNVEEIVKGLKNQKKVNIEKKTLQDNEYATMNEHVKIKNIFEGYTKGDVVADSIVTYTKEENGQNYYINYFAGDANYQLVDAYVSDELDLYNDNGFLKGDAKDSDRKGFLEKHNIKNDIDFYKFAADNYFIESSFFTDTKTLKQNYTFNVIASIVLPEIEGWTIFEGDLNGFCLELGNDNNITVYEITIIDNNKRYGLFTNDPRFKDESFVIDVVSSIVIR